jgi:hypothetical protein
MRAQAFVEEALQWLSDAPSGGDPALAIETAIDTAIDTGTTPAGGAISRHAGSRIVVADDNADMRRYLRAVAPNCEDTQAIV